MYFYSPSDRGFYVEDIHGDNIPADCVPISKQYYEELLIGQQNGKIIVPDDKGYPILVNPPAPTLDQLIEEIKLDRLLAYRQESDPLFFKWQRGEATQQEWLDKIEEIKIRYPYPTE